MGEKIASVNDVMSKSLWVVNVLYGDSPASLYWNRPFRIESLGGVVNETCYLFPRFALRINLGNPLPGFLTHLQAQIIAQIIAEQYNPLLNKDPKKWGRW